MTASSPTGPTWVSAWWNWWPWTTTIGCSLWSGTTRSDSANAIRVKELTLTGAANVADEPSLFAMPADVFVKSSLLFDLARCPAGSPGEVAVQGGQANPLLGNVEGMALGGTLDDGVYEGRRILLMVVDDNRSEQQLTRLYSIAVKL